MKALALALMLLISTAAPVAAHGASCAIDPAYNVTATNVSPSAKDVVMYGYVLAGGVPVFEFGTVPIRTAQFTYVGSIVVAQSHVAPGDTVEVYVSSTEDAYHPALAVAECTL